MGSSFTAFRGKGFWSRDGLLEAWLRVLSLHLDDGVHKPGWQHDLRDTWLLASAGFFSGCIALSLPFGYGWRRASEPGRYAASVDISRCRLTLHQEARRA
jgi:hypothetical protein